MIIYVASGKGISLVNKANCIVLFEDSWNDYSFFTMFSLMYIDEHGNRINLGRIKIGFKGQTEDQKTISELDSIMFDLEDRFFSVGEDVELYRNISSLGGDKSRAILKSLRDIVFDNSLIEENRNEDVLSKSLLREFSVSMLKGQLRSILQGNSECTNYEFKFVRPETQYCGRVSLDFDVIAYSKPATNIHALIGRNGIGKTTLLNDMISSVIDPSSTCARFYENYTESQSVISKDYFSRLISVSFSAFDPFSPLNDQPDPAKGTCYYYIGLKDTSSLGSNRSIEDLYKLGAESLVNCFIREPKTTLWRSVVENLSYDIGFADIDINRLESSFRKVEEIFSQTILRDRSFTDSPRFINTYYRGILPLLKTMSSGHAIIILTLARLVATVEDKSLIIIDEPESHLHPPLLSLFIKSLSDLLYVKNGVAILATHSPVVLQGIPKSSVWKIYRNGNSITHERPSMETFGENVGVLTSEVFNLEVARSGFHALLAQSVTEGASYEEIIKEYRGQLGLEGRAILRVLLAKRERDAQ